MTGNQQNGFSLIEVIVALMILSVGILAMGVSTGHVMAQIQAAELRTERMSAYRQAAETLKGTSWDSLETACGTVSNAFDTDHYDVTCTVTIPTNKPNLKEIRLISVGPGFVRGQFTATVTDTMNISIANPV